jgi:hypothetical protein
LNTDLNNLLAIEELFYRENNDDLFFQTENSLYKERVWSSQWDWGTTWGHPGGNCYLMGSLAHITTVEFSLI